jgi:hypothetical protein
MSWFDDALEVASTGMDKAGDGVDDAFHYFNPQQADSLTAGGSSMSDDMGYTIKNAMWEASATPEEKKLANIHPSDPFAGFHPFQHYGD